MNARGFGGGDHLFPGGVLSAVGDIFKNSAVKEPGVLQHHRVGAAQAVARDVADFRAVHGNFSGIDVVKAHEQVDDCRFSGTGRTDDGHRAAGLRRQG